MAAREIWEELESVQKEEVTREREEEREKEERRVTYQGEVRRGLEETLLAMVLL